MSSYKLVYFNVRARAELSRLVFVVARQKYEDVRITSEQWKEMKPKMPFGQLPVLEVDGITLSQSMTIARFLAKRFNLMGKNEIEEAQVNMIVDSFCDGWAAFTKTLFGSDEAKAAAKKSWDEDKSVWFLSNCEKYLSSNNAESDYFVGNGLTLADLAVVNFLFVIEFDGTKYPKLNTLKTKVESVPEIADWMAKRPVTTK